MCPAVLYDTIQRDLYCHLNCGHMEWDHYRPAGVWDSCQEGLRQKSVSLSPSLLGDKSVTRSKWFVLLMITESKINWREAIKRGVWKLSDALLIWRFSSFLNSITMAALWEICLFMELLVNKYRTIHIQLPCLFV